MRSEEKAQRESGPDTGANRMLVKLVNRIATGVFAVLGVATLLGAGHGLAIKRKSQLTCGWLSSVAMQVAGQEQLSTAAGILSR